MPEFAAAMSGFLAEAQVRVNRPALVNATMRRVTAKYYEDMKTMNDIVDKSASCSLRSSSLERPPISQRSYRGSPCEPKRRP
jgi:hypothetical protein